MMQSLLVTRFKLAIHRETRELPMYAMGAAKDGVKVHPIEDSGDAGREDAIPFRHGGARAPETALRC